jgi:tRNA-splicing ligase RtcB (3'-phosphate/5'-hydroxy nucleic acid ligase)
MSIAELQGKNVPVKLWTKLEDVESEALTQLKNIASLPWVFRHVAVMPDVHFGIGATVGSVIAMKDAISPAAVGVDIGCGMGAIRTNLKADALPDSLTEIRNKIEQKIPVGFNEHRQPKVQSRTNSLFAEFRSLHPKVMKLESKAIYQCGTLGGGNHFIELCLDTENTVWMMLHSGSRNIGKTLAEIHISTAKKLTHNTYLPDRDLAVFLANTPEMEAYRRDLFWAQRYALLNRQTMFEIYKTILKGFFPEIKFEEPILCHHNYVSEETHFGEDVIVTRKGAISAREGEWGIIPGSMGTKSYIVRGLGNPESFHSASHGAGRRMSRTQAKKNYTLQDLEAQTSGVECRKDGGVLDEIPGAYKNIDEVINNQKDLVKVEFELKQILCVKG